MIKIADSAKQGISKEELKSLEETIEKLPTNEVQHLQAYLEVNEDANIRDALHDFVDYRFYNNMTIEEVAKFIIAARNEEGLIPDWLLIHIDYESVARELVNDGDFTETAFGVIVL